MEYMPKENANSKQWNIANEARILLLDDLRDFMFRVTVVK